MSAVFSRDTEKPKAFTQGGKDILNAPASKIHELIIIGGGTAGLFAALEAARSGLRPLLLEAGLRFGRKLAISGGGHCNFSNTDLSATHYLAPGARDFCAPALENFGYEDLASLLASLGFGHTQKEHGRLFLTVRASELVAMLLDRIGQAGGKLLAGQEINQIEAEKGLFRVAAANRVWRCRRLILAQGSPAAPALARIADPLNLAMQLGHRSIPFRPALVPLLFTEKVDQKFGTLAGIGLPVRIHLQEQELAVRSMPVDNLLFTASGLSGPAILTASLHYGANTRMGVDFLPGRDFECLLDEKPKATALAILKKLMPARLAGCLLPMPLAGRKAAELSRADRQKLGALVNRRFFAGLKPGGFRRAEVCSGGVALEKIDRGSMESRLAPGLYLIGEMLNVTGELGGYNIHWAYASARLAVRHICATRVDRDTPH